MPVALRDDFDAPRLRAIARGSRDAGQTRRLLALAAVYDGARRSEAAAIGGVTLQIVRDWVMKFNAHGPDGLIDRKAPGQPPKLNAAHRAALEAAIESGPTRRLTRPGRMAPVRPTHRAAEHHACPAAAQMPRTQPGRKHLAVHPRQ